MCKLTSKVRAGNALCATGSGGAVVSSSPMAATAAEMKGAEGFRSAPYVPTQVVITSITPEVKMRRDVLNEITLRLAEEYGIKHTGWGEDYQGSQDVTDGIHRTQEASDRLAALLVKTIKNP